MEIRVQYPKNLGTLLSRLVRLLEQYEVSKTEARSNCLKSSTSFLGEQSGKTLDLD